MNWYEDTELLWIDEDTELLGMVWTMLDLPISTYCDE